MAQFRDATQIATGTTGAFEIARPPLTQALDVLVAAHSCDIGPISDMTPSDAGWTPLGSWNWANTSDSGGMRLWARPAAVTDPEDWQWAQPDGADGALSIVAISETTLAALVVTMATATQTDTVTAPAQTAARASGLVLRIGGAATSVAPISWITPAGHTARSSASSSEYASVSVVTAPFTNAALPGVSLTAEDASRNMIGVTLSAGDAITSQNKNASDTAGLAETATVQVTQGRPDAAAVSEQAAAGPAVSDSTAVAEEQTVAATLDAVDHAAAVEQATTSSSGGSADGSAVADSAHLGVHAGRDDTAELAEAAHIHISTTDAASVNDTAHVEETLGPVAADHVAVGETSAVAAHTSTADGALIEESATVAVARTASDSGSLTEESAAGPRTAEMAALAEQASVLVVLERADTLSAADEGAAGRPVPGSDSATLTEQSAVSEVGREITGIDPMRRRWSAAAAARDWSVDLPRRGWSASPDS